MYVYGSGHTYLPWTSSGVSSGQKVGWDIEGMGVERNRDEGGGWLDEGQVHNKSLLFCWRPDIIRQRNVSCFLSGLNVCMYVCMYWCIYVFMCTHMHAYKVRQTYQKSRSLPGTYVKVQGRVIRCLSRILIKIICPFPHFCESLEKGQGSPIDICK